ncbi:hypothetical protein G6F62_014745 [Rhizopus arrhizus]|nr:hypothetical protein G6F62_014745 [Rhizopus arrhizus]
MPLSSATMPSGGITWRTSCTSRCGVNACSSARSAMCSRMVARSGSSASMRSTRRTTRASTPNWTRAEMPAAPPCW